MTKNKSRYVVSEYGLDFINVDQDLFFHSQVCAYKYGLSYKDENVANFLDHRKEVVEKNWNFVFGKYFIMLTYY